MAGIALLGDSGWIDHARTSAGTLFFGRCYRKLHWRITRCRAQASVLRDQVGSGQVIPGAPSNRLTAIEQQRDAMDCVKSVRQAMFLFASARLSVLGALILMLGLSTIPLSHEIVQSLQVLEEPREEWQRQPDEEWGYTPLLARTPRWIHALALRIDDGAETLVRKLVKPPRGRQSAFSASTIKLAMALTGMLVLPLAGLRLAGMMRRRAARTLRQAGLSNDAEGCFGRRAAQ